jgi:hypothetical protein
MTPFSHPLEPGAGALQANTPVPAHLVYFLLRAAGWPAERVRFHAWVGPDFCFSDLVRVDTEDGPRGPVLHLYFRRRGLTPHLPGYLREWAAGEGGGAVGAFADFCAALDNALLREQFRAEVLPLIADGGDGLSLAERFVVDFLALRPEDWAPGGRWARDDVARWAGLLPAVAAGQGGVSVVLRALEAFFPFLRRGKTLDAEEVVVAEPLPEPTHFVLGERNLGERTYLGGTADCAFTRLGLHLGPLGLRDYWSLLPPEEVDPDEAFPADLGVVGILRPRLAAVLRQVMPAHLVAEVRLTLSPAAWCRAPGHHKGTVCILGHTMALAGEES